MLSKSNIIKQRLDWIPWLMVLLHALLMLGVGYTWYQAVQEHGIPAGPEASRAYAIIQLVDFAVYWITDRIVLSVLESNSSQIEFFSRWTGVDTFGDIELYVRWPLLLLMGSIQWFLIGLGIIWGRRLKEQ